MRNKGGMGPGAMKMGGPGAKPKMPASAGIGTKMPGGSLGAPGPSPLTGGGGMGGPKPPGNPLAGGPMPPMPGGGMKKGGTVDKHAKGGSIKGLGPIKTSSDKEGEAKSKIKSSKEVIKHARGGGVGGEAKPRVAGGRGYH